MIFKNHEKIVFTGDSVTDVGSKNPVGQFFANDLGTGYVRVIQNMIGAYYPELILRIANSAISGNDSAALNARFDRDVIALEPDYISICIGINDVWRQFDVPSFPTNDPEVYERNMTEMIEKSIKVAKKVFILSPYYMEPNKEEPMRKRMNEYIEICRRLSEKYGCEFIDLQEMFDNYLKFRHSSYLSYDRVHPNLIAATLMAKEFLKHCGFDYDHVPSAD